MNGITEYIDFKKYPNIVSCSLPWSKQTEGILECTSLRRLHTWHLPFENLEPLSQLVNLESLSVIQWRRLKSIAPIGNFSKLKVLLLAYLPRLEHVGELADCSRLEKLEIQKCKRLTSVQPLDQLQAIKSVSLDDCEDIESLAPLVNCSSLQFLSFSGTTKIADGDLGVLLKNKQITHLDFYERKHYTHNSTEWHAARFPNSMWSEQLQFVQSQRKKGEFCMRNKYLATQ